MLTFYIRLFYAFNTKKEIMKKVTHIFYHFILDLKHQRNIFKKELIAYTNFKK